MIRKIVLVLLLLVSISVGIILYMKQPATMTVGEYETMPHIDVTFEELNIAIDSSPDDKIHVQMQGHKLNKNMLTINEESNRFVIKEQQRKTKWTDSIRFRASPMIIVQLPKNQKQTLTLNSADGDVAVQNLELDTIQVNTSAGMTYLNSLSVSNAELHTKDGDVSIAKSAIENVNITSNAGDVFIEESTGSTHTIQTVDGQIQMTEAAEQQNVDAKSESGDIGINYKKAPVSLQITTVAEDVVITLPKYDKETHMIGDGANMLSAETKDGVIMIR